MKKVERILLSQIIALTKSIWLTEHTQVKSYVNKFIGGKSKIDSIGISWWYTEKAFKISENIASMFIESNLELAICDLDTAEKSINKTLQSIFFDEQLFTIRSDTFTINQTLYDCKSQIETESFGKIILENIYLNIKNQLSKWSTVYVAPRLSGETFFISEENLWVINRKDTGAWKNIVDKGYLTNEWSPETGNFFKGERTCFSSFPYDYIYLTEEFGTQKGSNFISQLKLRKLFAIVFSVIFRNKPHPLSKCEAEPNSNCIQFPFSNQNQLTISINSIGVLLPYYLNGYKLSREEILLVQTWYHATVGLSKEKLNRIDKCAFFINRAMNSNDIESYINYFIALDALFGVIRKVEASILNGIKSMNIDPVWEQKTRRLFKLRSELVHGGSRNLKEWNGYYEYYKHFDSLPEKDMEKIAFTALYNAPNVLVGL